MSILRRVIAITVPVLLAAMLTAGPAIAQKSQKTQKAEKPRPVQSVPSTIKDILQKYEGKTTSLGTLKNVAGDYFVVEQEGVATIRPLSTIHSLRVVKDEEAGTETLEIQLTPKD
jgi:hypothetical protein